MTLAEWDIPRRGRGPDPRAAADDALYWVELRAEGPRLCRCDGARLVLDLKAGVGIATTTNTAFGPTTVDALRASMIAGGAPAGEVPKPSAQWHAGERLPEWLVRTMIWWTYARALGGGRESVIYDGQTDTIRYGEALGPGTRAAPSVRCEPVSRRTPGDVPGHSSSTDHGTSGGGHTTTSGGTTSGGTTSGGTTSGGTTSGGTTSGGTTSEGEGETSWPVWKKVLVAAGVVAAIGGGAAVAMPNGARAMARPLPPPPPPPRPQTSTPAQTKPAPAATAKRRTPTTQTPRGDGAAYGGLARRIRRVSA